MAKINKRRKEILWDKLYKRDGRRCYYCGIKEGDFILIWEKFYDGKTRGRKLEIDQKDNQKGYDEENCVLACPICNNAKSDKFTYEEFRKLGRVIKEILGLKRILKKRNEGI